MLIESSNRESFEDAGVWWEGEMVTVPWSLQTMGEASWKVDLKKLQIDYRKRKTEIMKVTMQYNTIQNNAIQYNTIQYNTIQYKTIQ